MERVILQRDPSTDEGTFGYLKVGKQVFYTLELPWRDLDGDKIGDSDYSCITPGTYVCEVTLSERFKKQLYQINNVAKRNSIRIHSANWAGDKKKGFKCDLEGCIGIGSVITIINGQKAIGDSKLATAKFMALLNNEKFELEIRNPA